MTDKIPKTTKPKTTPKPKTTKTKPKTTKPKTTPKPKTTKTKPKTTKPKTTPKPKTTKTKPTPSKSNEDQIDDMGIVIVDDDITIDKDKINEERRAYLEEARSQEAFD